MKCLDIMKNTDSEGSLPCNIDAEVRKRREQTGLDTLVVHAVNDVDLEVVPLRRGFRS